MITEPHWLAIDIQGRLSDTYDMTAGRAGFVSSSSASDLSSESSHPPGDHSDYQAKALNWKLHSSSRF